MNLDHNEPKPGLDLVLKIIEKIDRFHETTGTRPQLIRVHPRLALDVREIAGIPVEQLDFAAQDGGPDIVLRSECRSSLFVQAPYSDLISRRDSETRSSAQLC